MASSEVIEKRVGFGPRFGAYVIDVIILNILSRILGAVTEGILSTVATSVEGFVATIIGAAGALFLLGVLYWGMEAITGFTVGKLVLKLKIAREDGQPGDINLWLKRFALKNIATLLMFLTIIGSLIAPIIGLIFAILAIIGGLVIFVGYFFVFSDSKQTLHDKWSGSAVFKKDDIGNIGSEEEMV